MLAKNTQTKALHWLGRQLFNRNDPAAFFDPLLEKLDPMLVKAHTPARVEQVIQETRDTRTFILKPAARWLGFQAGQHVNISVDVGGIRRTRTFSLSSSPELWAKQGLVTLTIKRLPGGLVTNWLHDNLSYGDVIGFGEAFGDFLLPQPPQPALYRRRQRRYPCIKPARNHGRPGFSGTGQPALLRAHTAGHYCCRTPQSACEQLQRSYAEYHRYP